MDVSESGGPMEGDCSPREAAEALGVSSSGLRRLAEIYSAVRGELPRDPKSRSRIWPERAVNELGVARSLVLQGRAASIREALEAVGRGETVPEGWPGIRRPGLQQPERMETELRSLHSELALIRGELAELRRVVAGLSSVPGDFSPAPARRLPARQAPDSDGGDERELQRLRRRLRYLQAELEVREL